MYSVRVIDMADSPPPNFGTSKTFPLQGERVGPAWRRAWLLLDGVRFQRGIDLAADMAASAVIQPKTAIGLLSKARACGILEVRYEVRAGRRYSMYRITEKYL